MGGNIVDLGETNVVAGMIAAPDEGPNGMVVYTTGTTSPLTLRVRPIGCE